MFYPKVVTFILFITLSCLSCANVNAKTFTVKTNTAKKELEIITGFAKPPYILPNISNGIQPDLFKEAFKSLDLKVKFTSMPFGRNIIGFLQMDADGIFSVPPENKLPGAFLSEPYIVYQNVAVSLLENDLTIKTVADLSGKSIAAFQNASKYLGEEYAKTVKNTWEYREVADQAKQMERLFMRRSEVIVLDINIFKYFIKMNASEKYIKPYKIHFIFDERPYSAAFKEEAMRDHFNKNIKQMKADGRYQKILAQYLTQPDAKVLNY